MIFQWPAKKPEPKGHSRRARRRQSADNIAMGGYMNLDGTYNESFQKAMSKEPLPKPVNPFGRPVLPQREANAPRYKQLKHQLRDNALVRKRIAKGEEDALATIVGTDEQGREIVAPRGFEPVWDDDMETVIGHMDWQNGIAVPLGHKFPNSEIVASDSGSDDLNGRAGDDTLDDQVSQPGMPVKNDNFVLHASSMRFPGVRPEEEPDEEGEAAESRDYVTDERWRPWFDKRNNEDPQQHDERIKRQSAQYITNIEENVYARGEADYEALEDETGISVVKGTGFSTEYRFPDGSTLPGLDSVGSRRLASVARDNASVREVLQQYAAGALTLEDVNSRLAFLENLPANPRAGLNQSHGYLTSQRRAEMEALQVAARALKAREADASPEEIGNIFIAGFAPDPMEDYKVAKELFLDFAPGFGEVSSALGAIVDFKVMMAAVEDGDWETAAEAGLFTVLGVAGAIPGYGKIAKPLEKLLKRGWHLKYPESKTISEYKLARIYENEAKDMIATNLEPFLKDIDDVNVQDIFKSAFSRSYGKAAERTVEKLLKGATFTPSAKISDRRVGKPSHRASSERIVDLVTPEDIDVYKHLLFRRGKKDIGTAVEVKAGKSRKNKSQFQNDEALKKNGVEKNKSRQYELHNLVDMLLQPHQVDIGLFEDILTEELVKAVAKHEKVHPRDAELFRSRILEFHNKSVKDHPRMRELFTALKKARDIEE